MGRTALLALGVIALGPLALGVAIAAPREFPSETGRADHGAAMAEGRGDPVWSVELAAGILLVKDDDYLQRAEEFGFHFRLFDDMGWVPTAGLQVERRLSRDLGLVFKADTLDHRAMSREVALVGDDSDLQEFEWRGYTFQVGLRVGSQGLVTGLRPYVQALAGTVLGRTSFQDRRGDYVQTRWSHALSMAAGLQALARYNHLGLDLVGGYGQVEYVYAPGLENLLGDVHDMGGLRVTMGALVQWGAR